MITPAMIDAAKVLQRSERGRRVATQLLEFLDGESAGLDQYGRLAVLALVSEFLAGPNPASTREILEMARCGEIT